MRYFVRHPTTQAMPRKVKTAFTATDADNAITQIHDVAFIPRLRDRCAASRSGSAAALRSCPGSAPTLYEFVELDNGDYLKVTEACMRIFDRTDWLRVNRARARIKVLIDKVEIDERAGAPAPQPAYASPNGDRRDFDRFLESNVAAQRQRGFCTVEVKVRRGDLSPEQLRGLGEIMRRYTGDSARTTVHQNLVPALGARRVGVRGLAGAGGARAR